MTARFALLVTLLSLSTPTAFPADPKVDQKAEAVTSRGFVALEKGDTVAALKDFEEAIRLAPTLGRAYLGRGIVRAMGGKWDKAIADFDEAVRLTPADPDAYYTRGLARLNTGALDQAISDFDGAIRLHPVRFPKFGGHEVNGVDSGQGVHRCLGSVRRTRPSTSSRP